MIDNRNDRLAALIEVIRPWARDETMIRLHSFALALDIVWTSAATEAKRVWTRPSRAKKRVQVETTPINAPPGAVVVKWADIAASLGESLPEKKQERRPPKCAADAAMRSTLAIYEALTGKPPTRTNAVVADNDAIERRGEVLAFCRALDTFYGLKVETDTRLKEAIAFRDAEITRRRSQLVNYSLSRRGD